MHALLPQAPPLPKHAHLAPCTAGSTNVLVIIDMQVKLALPLSLLLLGVQAFFDRYLKGQHEEDPVFNLSESLSAFKLSQGDRLEHEHGFLLTQPKMFGWNCEAIELGHQNNIGNHTSLFCLWRITSSPSFQCSPIRTSSLDAWGGTEYAVLYGLGIGCWPSFHRWNGCHRRQGCGLGGPCT